MEYSLEVPQYIVLLLGACLGGFVDSIAGGGGIITVPLLLSMGIDPHFVLGTNKMQASFGSFTASYNYTKKKLVSPQTIKRGILFTLLGSAFGTMMVQFVNAQFLQYIMPLLLMVIFLYILFFPSVSEKKKTPRLRPILFYLVFGLSIGFYDGFFGPGTGSFWTVAFVSLQALSLKSATAHTKIMNFTSNITSFFFFAISGQVLYTIGLLMIVGQIAGAYLGSHLVINHSTQFIKIFFLIVVAITIAKLMFETFIH